jgi:hypothetical protein
MLLLIIGCMEFAFGGEAIQQSIEGGACTSIFVPLTQEDSLVAASLELFKQEVKVDVYDGYAAVNSVYWFNNASDRIVEIKVGFPSASQAKNYSSKYWLRYHVNNGPPFVAHDTLLETSWLWWKLSFRPGVTEVKLYYGVATEGAALPTDNRTLQQNGLQYDAGQDRKWKGSGTGNIWIRMNDGYTTQDIMGVLPPRIFQGGNAILHVNVADLIMDSTRQLLIWYPALDTNNPKINRISWEQKFNHLAMWNPDQKTLTTLTPFYADDFDGKKKSEELDRAHSIEMWKKVAGLLILVLVIGSFMFSELKSRRTHLSRRGGSTRE